MKAIFKKIVALAAMAVLAVGSLFPAAISTSAAEASATSALSLETSRIEDDLADVNKVLYPPNPRGTHQLIRFQEYCFANSEAYEKASKLYGLYFYIYNPTKIPFREDPVFHCANMATAYNADGEPSSYENVKLTFVDRTDDHLFYKFRVADPASFLEMAQTYANAHGGERRYDIVSVQLYNTSNELLEGEALAAAVTDGVAAATWKFSGFGRGCSEATENTSTLSATVDRLEVLNLKVEHTNYRTREYVDFICDEINTVYFSVPKKYFEDYGGLQKIKASWYEYKTKPIFATWNSSAYTALEEYVGVNIGEKNESLRFRIFWEERIYKSNLGLTHEFSNNYNGKIENLDDLIDFGEIANDYTYAENYKTTSCIDWLILLNDNYNNYITREEIEDVAMLYTTRFPEQERLHGYAEGLFSDSIDADRIKYLENAEAKRGYTIQTIDAAEKKDLTILNKDRTFWDKFLGRNETETLSFDPIVVLGEDDLDDIADLTLEEFSQEYLVDAIDAQVVYDNIVQTLKKGERAILFRFAVTDYYSSLAHFDYSDDNASDFSMEGQNGIVSQMTAFLEYDVISLTFRNEGGRETIIGCVADPFNIWNGIDIPHATDTDGRIAALVTLAVVAIVFIIVMILLYIYARPAYDVIMHGLGVFLKWLLKGIWWFITLPFKGIGWIFEGINTLSRKK